MHLLEFGERAELSGKGDTRSSLRCEFRVDLSNFDPRAESNSRDINGSDELSTFKEWTLVLVCAAVEIGASSAFADSTADPYSYTKSIAGGKFVFAMIARDAKLDAHPQIRGTFRVSGLYKNDGTNVPLWTVDWYSYNVMLLDDGVHLVRPGPWASDYDDLAVAFYANGKLVREYAIDELVRFPQLMPHTASHFEWRRSSDLDELAGTYLVTTMHGERYTFDAKTGEIKSAFSPFGFALLSAAVMVGVFVLYWVVRRNNKT